MLHLESAIWQLSWLLHQIYSKEVCLVSNVSNLQNRTKWLWRYFSLEAAARGVLWKKVFLKISKNSQKNTCARVSFLIKLQAAPATLLKRDSHRCFPVNFAKFLRIPFLQNTSGRLPLFLSKKIPCFRSKLFRKKDIFEITCLNYEICIIFVYWSFCPKTPT